MTNLTHRHLDWIDRARGLGIILVVFGHVADGVFRAGIPFSPADFKLVYAAIYSFHMPLFFFLAGLHLYRSWQSRGSLRLIQSKVDTILYPYLLWSLLQGSIEIAASGYTNHHTSLENVLSLLWMPRQQFWFLYVLFIEFVLGAWVCALVPRRWHVLVAVLCGLMFVFRAHGPHVGPVYYLAAESVFFFAGLGLRDWVLASRDPSWTAVAATGIGFAALQAALAMYRDGLDEPGRGILELAVAAVSIAFVIEISRWSLAGVGRWLELLGRQSLAIYLMHTIFAAGTRIALLKVLGVQRLDVHLILGTALGLAVPLVCAELIRRAGIQGVFAIPRRWRLEPGNPRTTTEAAS